MQYKNLGRSGLKVSQLSYGAWVSFGNQLDVKEAKPLLQCCRDNGVNFFDNAEVYANGRAEEIMGQAIRELGWKRSDLVISTKIFWGGPGPNDKGLSRKHIVEGTKASLKRLDMDYVDVIYCHRPDAATPIEETVRAMNYVIDEGWAFYWGTSEWSAQQITEAWGVANRLDLVGPVVEQPEYNLLSRHKVEVEYLPLYSTYGLGLTTWSPLASGVLTGKYSKANIPPDSRFALENYKNLASRSLVDDTLRKVNGLKPIAEELGVPLSQLAIAWCASNPNVSSVITGATKESQRLKRKVTEKSEGKRVRVPGLGEFIAVDDSEASDAGSPRFEADTSAEAPTTASVGVGTAPMEHVDMEEVEEEDADVHFKRKREGGSRRKRVVKKPRRYAPTVIAEGESSAVPPPSAPLVIRLSAPMQTTGKAAPDPGTEAVGSPRAEAAGEQGEHYDPLFTYKEGGEAGYFAVSEESGGDVADVGPSGAGTSKGSPVTSSSFGWTTEGSTSEGGPAIRVDSAKDFSMEPAGTDAAVKTIEATSSFGVPPLGASTSREPTHLPEGTRGEVSTSTAADAAELDALYHRLPSYQPELARGNEIEGTVIMEPTSLPTTSVSGMPSVSPVPPILPAAELKVITSPTSPTLVVEPALPEIVTSHTLVVASVLVSMRTPPRSPTTPHVAATSASVIFSTVTPVKPVETLSSGAARLPGVIEVENEFVAELVDSFYKSLKRSIALVLKGSTTSFSALKVVLSRSIDSIRDFGGDDQAATLELLVDRIERDVDEWRRLSHSDLESSVNEQLAHLIAQMHEAHLAAQEAAKAISSDLKSLETRKIELGNAIDASSSALLDAEDKIEKAKEMIRKANLLLSKAEPVRLEETARLEQLKAQNDEVLRQELAQRATLVEIEARLAQTASFNEAELRSQALIRAVEERKTRLAALKEQIKSYEAPL